MTEERTHRQAYLVQNVTEKPDLAFNLLQIVLPEPMRLRFGQAESCGLLHGPCGGVAEERVCVLHGLDERRGTDHETEAPSGCVEELADGAYGQSVRGDGGADRDHVREGWHEVDARVDFVADEDEVVGDADGSYG